MPGTFLFSTEHIPELRGPSVLRQSISASLTQSISLPLLPSNQGTASIVGCPVLLLQQIFPIIAFISTTFCHHDQPPCELTITHLLNFSMQTFLPLIAPDSFQVSLQQEIERITTASSLLSVARASLPRTKPKNSLLCLWHSTVFLSCIKYLTMTRIKKQIQITHCWKKKKS